MSSDRSKVGLTNRLTTAAITARSVSEAAIAEAISG